MCFWWCEFEGGGGSQEVVQSKREGSVSRKKQAAKEISSIFAYRIAGERVSWGAFGER